MDLESESAAVFLSVFGLWMAFLYLFVEYLVLQNRFELLRNRVLNQVEKDIFYLDEVIQKRDEQLECEFSNLRTLIANLNDNSLDLATPVEDKSDPVVEDTAKTLDEEPIVEPVAVGLEEPANPVAIDTSNPVEIETANPAAIEIANPAAIEIAKPKQRKPRKKQLAT